MTASRQNNRQRSPNKTAPTSPTATGGRWFIAVVVLLLVAGAFVIAVVASNRTSETVAEQTADVAITGDPIAPLPFDVQVTDTATDPEAGKIAPTLIGTDFDGNQVTIEADGRAKAIYFLAHWCPHCQAEVPAVQQLVSEGLLPEGMDVYAVSTGVDPTQGNYPPEIWLADEEFQPPTMRDDTASSAFTAFGGSSFPYAVYLDADHRIVARSAGQLGKEAITALWLTTSEHTD